MSRFWLFALALLLVAAGCSGDSGGSRLTATLAGAGEVPGPGDADGSGSATVTLDRAARTVCYELSVSGIAPAAAAHIHAAEAGKSGPVVLTLDAPSAGQSTGCIDGVERDLIKRLADRPANYYVNVHTPDFPDGALRGQLRR
jgi:hypothetical protein